VTLVRIEREDGSRIARVVMHRPEARNAVSREMLAELTKAFGDLATEDRVRAIVLAGDGPDFCAGADLGDVIATGSEGDYPNAFEAVVDAIQTNTVPVVAEVQGSALGAGAQLVVACDLAVAAEDARLGIPSARLGILINYENVERLLLAVGRKRAGEFLYAARIVNGTEAAAWGLVNGSVPAGELRERAMELAGRVAELAPLSVRGSKRGLTAALDRTAFDRARDGHRVVDFEMMAAAVFASEDLREGIAAFRERRSPKFRGR
jgi:enoyl-CoA hydratase/carnithine racemase